MGIWLSDRMSDLLRMWKALASVYSTEQNTRSQKNANNTTKANLDAWPWE